MALLNQTYLSYKSAVQPVKYTIMTSSKRCLTTNTYMCIHSGFCLWNCIKWHLSPKHSISQSTDSSCQLIKAGVALFFTQTCTTASITVFQHGCNQDMRRKPICLPLCPINLILVTSLYCNPKNEMTFFQSDAS